MARSNPVDLRTTIRTCSFFHQLDESAVGRLVDLAQVRHYEAGHVIADQGDEPPGMFIVVQGLVRVYKLSPAGKEHVLHLAGPRQTFLEVAVLGNFPTPAYCETLEPSDCLLLPAGPLRRLLRADHDLCLQVLASMSGWVRQLVGLLEDIVLRDAVGRVARHLLASAGGPDGRVELRAMKKDLASHLNLTSETLSRSLRRLDDAGLIDASDRGAIRVLDREGLDDASEGMFPRV